jgi:hypothetical protein
VGEDHGSDVQVRIEDRAVRIGYPHAALGRHGRARGRGPAFCDTFVNKEMAQKCPKDLGGITRFGMAKQMGKMGSQLKNEGSTRFNETGGRR